MAEIARKPQTCRECNVSPQARASQARAGRAVAGCRVGGEVTGLTPGVGCAGRRDVNPVSIKPLPRGHTGGQAGFPWILMPLGTAPVTSGHEFRKAIPSGARPSLRLPTFAWASPTCRVVWALRIRGGQPGSGPQAPACGVLGKVALLRPAMATIRKEVLNSVRPPSPALLRPS